MSDTPTRDASCEARLPDHLDGRLRDFYALDAALSVHDAQTVRNVATAHHEALSDLDLLPSDASEPTIRGQLTIKEVQ